MTFLNTLANLGDMWPASFVLWFVDIITWKDCVVPSTDSLSSPLLPTANTTLVSTNATLLEGNVCYGDLQVDNCKEVGGSCDVLTEGYYYLCLGCFVIGALWLLWGWRTINMLQDAPDAAWAVVRWELGGIHDG